MATSAMSLAESFLISPFNLNPERSEIPFKKSIFTSHCSHFSSSSFKPLIKKNIFIKFKENRNFQIYSLPAESDVQEKSPEVLKDENSSSEVLFKACQKIRQMSKHGNLKGALEEMDNLQAMGIEPDVMVATALIDCCIRSGEMAKAEKAFNALFSNKGSLKPDSIAFGVLLGAYGKQKPPQWAKMERLIGRMEADFGIEPTVSEYNELVDVCARENHLEKGMDVIDRMKASGIEPNEDTINAVKRRRALRSHLRRAFAAEDY